METVCEDRMAIAMARAGGIGVIHRFLTIERQVAEVERTKRAEGFVIDEPWRLELGATVGDARRLMASHGASGLLLVGPGGRLHGILTSRDLLASAKDADAAEHYATTAERLVTAPPDVDLETARELLLRHRVEKLPLV